MPMLYLHQRNLTRSIEDLGGADFPDLEAAVDEAIISARDIMAARVSAGLKPDGWRFEITDARGMILAVIPFQDTLSADGSVDGRKHRWIRIDAI